MIALVLGLRAYLGADRSRARARAGVRASSGERWARILIADVAPADQTRQLVEDEGAEALVVPFRLLNGTEARWVVGADCRSAKNAASPLPPRGAAQGR
jgi:hypothetical protein